MRRKKEYFFSLFGMFYFLSYFFVYVCRFLYFRCKLKKLNYIVMIRWKTRNGGVLFYGGHIFYIFRAIYLQCWSNTYKQCSREANSFEGQIMSMQELICEHIFTSNGGYCFYYNHLSSYRQQHAWFWKLQNITQIFPSFSSDGSIHSRDAFRLIVRTKIFDGL